MHISVLLGFLTVVHVLQTSVTIEPTCAHSNGKPMCTPSPLLASPEFPACCVGIGDFIRGRSIPGNSERPNNSYIPPWLDLPLARRGQEFSTENICVLLVSVVYGVIVQLGVPDIRDVLLYTGKTLNRKSNLKRYAATLAQHQVWFADIWRNPPNQNNNSAFMESVSKVRDAHVWVAQAVNSSYSWNGYVNGPGSFENLTYDKNLWSQFQMDLENSTIPQAQRNLPPYLWGNVSVTLFNQQAMSLVLYNLVAFPILYPKELGIVGCDDDLWAYNHLVSVFGYSLGIMDEYNVALQPDLETARVFYKHILDIYVIPGLFYFEKPTYLLLETMFDGLVALSGGLTSPRILLYRFLKLVANIEAQNLYNGMTDAEQVKELSMDIAIGYDQMKDEEHRRTMNMGVHALIYAFGETQFPGQFTDYHNLSRYCHS